MYKIISIKQIFLFFGFQFFFMLFWLVGSTTSPAKWFLFLFCLYLISKKLSMVSNLLCGNDDMVMFNHLIKKALSNHISHGFWLTIEKLLLLSACWNPLSLLVFSILALDLSLSWLQIALSVLLLYTHLPNLLVLKAPCKLLHLPLQSPSLFSVQLHAIIYNCLFWVVIVGGIK